MVGGVGWGWGERAADLGPNLQEALRRHLNKRKYGAGKLRFSYNKKFIRKLPGI